MNRDQIVALRQRLGLTQTAFALRLGVSIQALQNWEQGRTGPSPMAMERLLECAENSRPDPVQRLEAAS